MCSAYDYDEITHFFYDEAEHARNMVGLGINRLYPMKTDEGQHFSHPLDNISSPNFCAFPADFECQTPRQTKSSKMTTKHVRLLQPTLSISRFDQHQVLMAFLSALAAVNANPTSSSRMPYQEARRARSSLFLDPTIRAYRSSQLLREIVSRSAQYQVQRAQSWFVSDVKPGGLCCHKAVNGIEKGRESIRSLVGTIWFRLKPHHLKLSKNSLSAMLCSVPAIF